MGSLCPLLHPCHGARNSSKHNTPLRLQLSLSREEVLSEPSPEHGPHSTSFRSSSNGAIQEVRVDGSTCKSLNLLEVPTSKSASLYRIKLPQVLRTYPYSVGIAADIVTLRSTRRDIISECNTTVPLEITSRTALNRVETAFAALASMHQPDCVLFEMLPYYSHGFIDQIRTRRRESRLISHFVDPMFRSLPFCYGPNPGKQVVSDSGFLERRVSRGRFRSGGTIRHQELIRLQGIIRSNLIQLFFLFRG